MNTVTITGNPKHATVTIRNVDLPLLEKQRKAFLHFTPGRSSYQDEIDGLENFLNAICDQYYHNSETPIPSDPPQLNKLLLGDEACRFFTDEGIEELSHQITNENLGYALYEFTGDLPDMLEQISGWGDYAFLTDDEYNTLSEL